ncbi:MAG: cystathionine gamma-synthase, partial [Actinomycetota bacterium]
MKFETKAIHSGQDPEPTTGAVVVPIYATSTYAQDAPGKYSGYDYSRTDNPTRTALQTALADLEGVDEGSGGGSVATSSGMAAAALCGYLLGAGDHVLLPDDAYGGTFRFFARVLGEQGFAWSVARPTDPDSVAAAMRENTRLVWVETPSNPLLRVADMARLAAIAHEGGALLVVDNTFATPYLQRPLEFGTDIVLHSTTKYLGGHSDVVGGALVTANPELHERLRFLQNAAGPVPGPFDAWLVLRGIKTLAVRMERHCANAMVIAEHLAADPRVAEVMYPGLTSHPDHALAHRQMDAFGGMVSFRPAGGMEAAHHLAERTEVFCLAESLGGVESLIEVPAAMTHQSVVGTPL